MRLSHVKWLILALVMATTLEPVTADAILTQQAKCREAVAKSARMALNTVVKARGLCSLHRLRRKLPGSVDCMADPVELGGAGTGDAKTDATLAGLLRWRDRRTVAVLTACQGVDLTTAGVADACTPPTSSAAAVANCAVLQVGKPAGDALAALIDVPQASSDPPLASRACFEVVTLALTLSPRAYNRLRADCFAAEEETGADYDCLATVAPPGNVFSTRNAETDELLRTRAQRWQSRVRYFCSVADLSPLNFPIAMGDPTGSPFTLSDLVERLYDAILAGASALDRASLPGGPVCGDGVVTTGEECDDGNRDSCDGCDRDCSISACGNGAACSPESCDDGNTASGDGCGAACNLEVPGCGNSVIDPGEQCDNGPNNSDSLPNACRTDCRLPHCGDVVIDTGEQCDPPSGSTCDASCKLLLCGNGILDSGEQCDQGGETATCDADCTFVLCGDGRRNAAAGEICDTGGNSATCDSDCSLPLCRDGIFNAAAGEGCDDGNSVDGDGCDSNCKPTGCGNGIVTAGEACDDGNTVSGDGCSSTCSCVGELGCFTQDPHCPDLGQLTLLAATGATCATNTDCLAGRCDATLHRCVTATELDTGWTGISHDSDVNDLTPVMGSLVCPGPGPTCGQCNVIGLLPDFQNCRCRNNNRNVCDKPFVADATHCGATNNTCDCYFGAPLPLSAGNTPACAVNRFAVDISGTANVDTGAGRINANLKSLVYLGESLVMPCPSCGGTCTAPAGKVGIGCGTDIDCDTSAGSGDGVCGNYDPTPGDGIRGGKCFLGDNSGLSCDVMAPNRTFPAPGGGGSSLDCFPSAGKGVSGTGLTINLVQTTGTSALPTAALSCAFGTGLCPCGECNGDKSVGCTANADCVAAGVTGPCVTNAENPNQCDDGICTSAGGGEGQCLANLLDKYCDAIVRANGEGFISCQGNADCSPLNIGIAAGNCTLSKRRECFLNPITATGVQDANKPLAVATFCVPKTSNSGINTVAGLPGPGRIKNQARSRLLCASNHAIAYQPGVGGCP